MFCFNVPLVTSKKGIVHCKWAVIVTAFFKNSELAVSGTQCN